MRAGVVRDVRGRDAEFLSEQDASGWTGRETFGPGRDGASRHPGTARADFGPAPRPIIAVLFAGRRAQEGRP